MWRSGSAGAIVVAFGSVANAQTLPAAPALATAPRDPALAYPIEVTDRPLLLPFGVTRFDFSLDWSWYLQNVVDANGNTTTIVTSSGHEHDGDFSLSYGLGPVELDARVVPQLAQIGATVGLGSGLGVVSVAFQYYAQQSYRPYEYGQSVDYYFKIIAIPRRLSFGGGLSARLTEVSSALPGAQRMTGTIVSVHAGGGATVQLLRRLSISAGASVGGPISYSCGLVSEDGASISTSSTLIVAFHRWDLYAQGGLDDLTRTVLPFAAVGFVHRWF